MQHPARQRISTGYQCGQLQRDSDGYFGKAYPVGGSLLYGDERLQAHANKMPRWVNAVRVIICSPTVDKQDNLLTAAEVHIHSHRLAIQLSLVAATTTPEQIPHKVTYSFTDFTLKEACLHVLYN